uniref:Uncharacterized protein n=1 Tax=Myotis myotis TaxID=51298 RepID=A0A7J7RLV5_MYOMY|nr:hypothetical protein mMyoMyo1_010284 [Myotis myotis]
MAAEAERLVAPQEPAARTQHLCLQPHAGRRSSRSEDGFGLERRGQRFNQPALCDRAGLVFHRSSARACAHPPELCPVLRTFLQPPVAVPRTSGSLTWTHGHSPGHRLTCIYRSWRSGGWRIYDIELV